MIEINILYYLLLLLPLLSVIFMYRRSPSNLPPGPFPWPVIGNILNVGSKPHISLTHLAKSYGPLISLRLGTQLVVVGSTPAAATEILKTHDGVLSARSAPHAVQVSPDRFHLSMAFADRTDQWKYLRMVCRTDLFSAQVIESQAKIREEKVTQLVEFLDTKEGEVVNIGGVAFATISNMLSNIFVSKDFMNLKDESEDMGMKKSVKKMGEVFCTPNLADLYTIFSGFDIQGLNKRSKAIAAQFYGLWEAILVERREGKGSVSRQRDFLDCLIDRGLDNDQINNLFVELFMAGTDTSTATVEWIMAELIKHPEVLKKVATELAKETSQGAIQESDLPGLRYLHSVVKETLRLHPPAPLLLPHRALETCKVMDYTIPKDTEVLVNLWAIGRDPTVWQDPLEFKPERFSESSISLSWSSFEFIPFGAGRRICPGLPMVAKQIPLILASLINCFNWSLPPDILPEELDMTDKFGVSLAKEKPLLLLPTTKTL